MNWGVEDFLIMGVMIFGTRFAFVSVARITPKKYHALLGLLFVVEFLWLWAELAVGVITNWGS